MNRAKHHQAADADHMLNAVETNVETNAETNVETKGRCSYCDQRCNADATYHTYCRDEFEYETRTHSRRQAPGIRKGSEEQH